MGVVELAGGMIIVDGEDKLDREVAVGEAIFFPLFAKSADVLLDGISVSLTAELVANFDLLRTFGDALFSNLSSVLISFLSLTVIIRLQLVQVLLSRLHTVQAG